MQVKIVIIENPLGFGGSRTQDLEAREKKPPDLILPLLVHWHWVTEVRLTVSNPAAVEADEFGVLCELFYLFELFIACQNTEMACMVSITYILAHISLPLG